MSIPERSLLKTLPMLAALLAPWVPRASAQEPPALSAEVLSYVSCQAASIVLTHVRIIDGLGGPAVEDQNLVLEKGRIARISPGADVAAGSGRVVLDLRGATVLPGLVGMHDHLFHIARANLQADGRFDQPVLVPQMTFSAPRLYLAAGVTTIRTAGSVEPYADLNVKRLIEAGQLPGPHLEVTAPYLEGADSPFIQMHQLTDAGEARRMVDYWADLGATSMNTPLPTRRTCAD